MIASENPVPGFLLVLVGKDTHMAYYGKNLRILAFFNLLVGAVRVLSLITSSADRTAGDIVLAMFRVAAIFLMYFLLIMAARKTLRLRTSLIMAYFVLFLNLWISFSSRAVKTDTFVSLGLMIVGFSTITLHQYYREERHWESVRSRTAQTLDLRVPEASQLFDPLIVGPHLEINTDIADAVERFVVSMKEMAPLDLCIYCGGSISHAMQETAIEAFREHFSDEERRLIRVLHSRNRRSMILFIIAMTIMFTWTPLNNSIGSSVIWTVLGNMGGFFLWEIGNTHFRHVEDYLELEHVLICKEADITFL